MEIIIRIPKKVAEFWRRHELFLAMLLMTQIVPVVFVLSGATVGYSMAGSMFPNMPFWEFILRAWACATFGWIILYGGMKAVWWLFNNVKIVIEEES